METLDEGMYARFLLSVFWNRLGTNSCSSKTEQVIVLKLRWCLRHKSSEMNWVDIQMYIWLVLMYMVLCSCSLVFICICVWCSQRQLSHVHAVFYVHTVCRCWSKFTEET